MIEAIAKAPKLRCISLYSQVPLQLSGGGDVGSGATSTNVDFLFLSCC